MPAQVRHWILNWKPATKAILSSFLAIALLAGCALPQVSAEDRLFLNVSVNLIGSYTLPKQAFEGEPIGGISAIAYDIPRDRLYALSDNRDRPRFYTFKATDLNTPTPSLIPEAVTYLKDNEGNLYSPGQLDPEGVALTPTGTLLISSEGSPAQDIAPAVGEYNLTTGQLQTVLPIPNRYIPDSILSRESAADPATLLSENAQGERLRSGFGNDSDPSRRLSAAEANPDDLPRRLSAAEANPDDLPRGLSVAEAQTQGIQENLSFEALAINVSSGAGGVYEPYRLFVATEGPLLQDLDVAPDIPYKNRLLHYTIDQYQTTLISEHLYQMELSPSGAVLHGLSDMAVLDRGGHFLGLERSYGFQGFAIKLFQLASGGATDISSIASLQGDTSGISPIRKELVLDLSTLPLPLQNYEAMTFGPTIGSDRSLLIMSDDNFASEQDTNLLVFQLN